MNGAMADASADELRALVDAWHALARRWELTTGEVVEILPGWSGEGTPVDGDTEERMRLMLGVGHRLRFVSLGEERDWLRAPAGRYRWLAPYDMIADGPPLLRRLLRHVEQEVC